MKFISIFKEEFNEYVKCKKSMGYDYSKDVVNTYVRLDRFFNDNNLTKNMQ